MHTQALIVGGGPVGLTLAIDLGRRGVRCTLIEQKEAPQFLPKMERCNARTMEIFRRMGIVDKVRAAGLRDDVPMDVFIILSLAEPPLLHLPYPSVKRARAEIRACSDGSMPLEPYQLISQYTLEPPTVAYRHRRQPLGDRLQQRLQRVLRDELVRFQGHAPVAAGADLGARPLHRRVGQVQEWGLGQRQDDEHVHRNVVAQAGGADLVDDSHAPEDFHGARIASLHLRQELRRFLLLDQRAAHAAPAEIDGERKTDRTAADDERLRVHRAYSALSICAYLG